MQLTHEMPSIAYVELAKRLGITTVACTMCEGSGRTADGDCVDCSGEGRVAPGENTADHDFLHHVIALLIEENQERRHIEDIDASLLAEVASRATREIEAARQGLIVGFDTFVSWRRECSDLAFALDEEPAYFGGAEDSPVEGFLYESPNGSRYYITRQQDGLFNLHIERAEWTASTLTMLERILFHTYAAAQINDAE